MNKNNWMKLKIQLSKQHQFKAFEEVNGLNVKEKCGKKILLSDNTTLTEFVSCSYLGLEQDQRIIRAVSQDVSKYGISFQTARTRIQPEINFILEALLNLLYGGHAITFPTLHLTHLGFLPLLASGEVPSFPLAENGVLFFLDKTAHSSIQINRGLMEQFGDITIVNFQQPDRLKKYFLDAFMHKKTPIAIGDSIGSMGGVAPIVELLALAEKYNGYVYLDDAHGTSVHGKHGCGYVLKCLDYQFHPRLILTATLAKAFATLGGVLLLPTEQDKNFTIRFSPIYLFGASPPVPIVSAAIASAKIHLTDEIYELQRRLWDNVNYFDSLIYEHIINANTPSPIRGIFMGDEYKAIKCAKELQARGFLLTAAMYPTVAKGKSILRACISALHTKQDIAALCENVKEIISNKS